jgi:DNA-binding beta-propeller fold protein YncE
VTALSRLALPGPAAGDRTLARHRPVPGWPPADPAPGSGRFTGDTASVAIGPDATVWVFHRGPVPVVQLDLAGRVVRAWGAGEFDRPHGITVDRFGDLYLVDEFGHVVEKRSPDGEIRFVLGRRGDPAAWQGGGMFNRPTSAAVHPRTGEIFVADGYGNSRIHRFDRNGRHLGSWGSPGGALGCFSLPHHVRVLSDDLLVVSDRENFRLQFFDTEGTPRSVALSPPVRGRPDALRRRGPAADRGTRAQRCPARRGAAG